MRAVVLKPLVGVVTQSTSTSTRLLGGTLSVHHHHRRHSGGWLRRCACRRDNGRRCGRCWSSKVVWGTGDSQHPTHCSLAQQTTRGESAGYTPTLTSYKATTSANVCCVTYVTHWHVSVSSSLCVSSTSISLHLFLSPIFSFTLKEKTNCLDTLSGQQIHFVMIYLARNLSKSNDWVLNVLNMW